MKFAKVVLNLAGIYGILILTPGLFMEQRFNVEHPPAVTHPEQYYGFICVALAFQFVFLIMARDPVRYRMFFIPSFLEKGLYGIAAIWLYWNGRIDKLIFGVSCIDLFLLVLFIIAYIKTPKEV